MSSQQSLLSDRKINIRNLNEIINHVIFPDVIHNLKKMVAQIPQEDSKFSYADELKNRFKTIEKQARNGKRFVSAIKKNEGKDKTIGCSESGYLRFKNPIDGKNESIQFILYKKPVNLAENDFKEMKFCSQFNSNTSTSSNVTHSEFSFSSMVVKNLSSAIGGIVRDSSLTDQFSLVKSDGRIEKYNDEKKLRIKQNTKEPALS